MARYHATDQTELWKLGSRLVEGLTGEALKVAMVMGHKELSKDTAVPTLVDKVKKHIFPWLQLRQESSTKWDRELVRSAGNLESQ